jgi:hypothetical protein
MPMKPMPPEIKIMLPPLLSSGAAGIVRRADGL